MNTKLFHDFLSDLNDIHPTLIEAVRNGFRMLYESDMQQEPKICITYEIITPESAENGEAAERGWENKDGVSMQPDEFDLDDGVTAVDLAVKFLTKEFANEPSSSHFHNGVWYTAYGSQNYRDGSYTNRGYHLVGFTPEQEEQIFNKMKSA